MRLNEGQPPGRRQRTKECLAKSPESREVTKDLICLGMQHASKRRTWFEKREHAATTSGTRHLRMDSVPTEQRTDLVHFRMTDAQRNQKVVVHLAQLLKRTSCSSQCGQYMTVQRQAAQGNKTGRLDKAGGNQARPTKKIKNISYSLPLGSIILRALIKVCWEVGRCLSARIFYQEGEG